MLELNNLVNTSDGVMQCVKNTHQLVGNSRYVHDELFQMTLRLYRNKPNLFTFLSDVQPYARWPYNGRR